jgi:hypothetical protein
MQVQSAQQNAFHSLKQLWQSPPPLWPRRKLAADALLANSTNAAPTIARDAEGTRIRTRCQWTHRWRIR